MTKILIVAPSWVGDMVMAQPLFKRLHERHANLVLDVLAPAWTLPLLQHMPEINQAIPNPFLHGELKLRARYRLGKQLKQRGYEEAIVLPNSFKSALIPFFAGIPLRTGYIGEGRWGLINDTRRLDNHALPLMVERFVALGENASAPLQRPIPGTALHIDEQARSHTLQTLQLTTGKPVAAFCIGAEYGPAKRWPAHYFADLAKRLAQQGYAVWLIGSAKDTEIGNQIQLQSGSICVDLCGKTNLSAAIDLLASSTLVVSNDSGLMHVAAALGKPMLALYGSSSPDFTPPLSAKARVISLKLECSPCFKRVCPLGHFNCMMQLTPERISQEIGKLEMARH